MDFKACPRCSGDLTRRDDLYGQYVACLQCGYSVDLKVRRFRRLRGAALKGKAGRPRKSAGRQMAA